MNQLHSLLEQGQSIWYDFISRDFIADGTMQSLVDKGLRGMTSNPTIFEKSISKGNAYDDQIRQLGNAGLTTGEIATQLFITDIRNACDVMRPVYEASGGADGFISIEVNPKLAADTEGTIAEAHHLWQEIDRENLMVKIPATPEGMPAIRHCIADGMNINITLMFSLDQYQQVANAYLSGLEDRLAAGKDISNVNSVASVFVSRIDVLIDELLGTIGTPEAIVLQGRAALANTKLVYQIFKEIFSEHDERWRTLSDAGARPQRPLWASTSTKNPDYYDLMYVDNLIGPYTVNTVPPETLEAIFDHADIRNTIEEGIDKARRTMEELAQIGVDVDAAMNQLIEEGVEKFAKSFDSLFEKLEAKRRALTEGEVAPK